MYMKIIYATMVLKSQFDHYADVQHCLLYSSYADKNLISTFTIIIVGPL